MLGESRSSPPGRPHLPPLDGLRGLAIALVLLCHGLASMPGTGVAPSIVRFVARGGWAGVELFFVLSGFLITRILLESRGGPGYFRRFYLRRAFRILPPYYALLALLALSLPLLPDAVAGACGPLLTRTGWLWGHAVNLYVARDWLVAGGRHVADVDPIRHLWSLGVEEQFYLVWPVVVLLASGRGALARASARTLALSVGVRALLAVRGTDPHVLYVLTPAHLDGFAVGAWLAAVERESPTRWDAVARRVRWLAAAPWPRLVTAGAVVVAGAFLLGITRLAEVPRVALFAVAFGALLAATLTADPAAPLGRFTRSRPMRTLGKYSYTLYLVHPVVQVAIGGPGAATALGQVAHCVAMLALSGAVAWTSWRVLERPLLRLKDRLAPVTDDALLRDPAVVAPQAAVATPAVAPTLAP